MVSIIGIGTLSSANSGPTYWEGYPSSEILVVQENNPIVVEKEDLIFDFTKENNLEYNDYNISGLVTAKYTMSNPTENSESVQMAFPMIATTRDFKSDNIVIEDNGEELDFEVFIGDIYNAETQIDFKSMVNQVSASEYSPEHYNLDEVGTLYTYDIAPTDGKEINVTIEHNYDTAKSRIMGRGFNGYESEDNHVKLSVWMNDRSEVEIFVLGDDVDFNVTAYTDVELKNETEKYTMDIKTEEISTRDYLNKQVADFTTDVYYLADNQILNMITKQLDEHMENEVLHLNVGELFSFEFFERFFVLIYEVDFAPESTREISVTYNTFSTMDRSQTSNPIHTFDYILSPAENWADFNNLNILIKPHEDYPYIINSSEDFQRNEDGIYMGNFQVLPEENLSFSLFDKEDITASDEVKGFLVLNSFFLMLLLFIVVPVIIVFIISMIYKKVNKSKK